MLLSFSLNLEFNWNLLDDDFVLFVFRRKSEVVFFAANEIALQKRKRVLGNQNVRAAGLVALLCSAREVHRIANRSEFKLVVASHKADRRPPAVQARANPYVRLVFCERLFFVRLGERLCVLVVLS